MYHISGTIQGVAPILFSRWTDGSEKSIRDGTSGGKVTDENRLLEAMEKVYRDDRGLYLPGWNFKKCLLLGSDKANLKEGKKGMSQFLAATVFPVGDPRFTGKSEPDFIHEVMGRRPPRTGGACLIKRPALSAGWELTFDLMVVDDRRSPDHIKRALEEAGLLVGLGSWRPEYGRFVVTDWTVAK